MKVDYDFFDNENQVQKFIEEHPFYEIISITHNGVLYVVFYKENKI